MRISGSGTLSEGKINDELNASGSIKLNGTFECDGFHSSSSLRGEGNLIVHGDVNRFDISLGHKGLTKRSIYKHPNKFYASIFGRDKVNLINSLVEKDVRGRKVYIGPKIEVLETVYYVDSIEVDDNAVLKNKPIQIKEELID
ncbi:MAG: hypothetical protein ACFFBH_10265 [Promethearchaeota archaeon]